MGVLIYFVHSSAYQISFLQSFLLWSRDHILSSLFFLKASAYVTVAGIVIGNTNKH